MKVYTRVISSTRRGRHCINYKRDCTTLYVINVLHRVSLKTNVNSRGSRRIKGATGGRVGAPEGEYRIRVHDGYLCTLVELQSRARARISRGVKIVAGRGDTYYHIEYLCEMRELEKNIYPTEIASRYLLLVVITPNTCSANFISPRYSAVIVIASSCIYIALLSRASDCNSHDTRHRRFTTAFARALWRLPGGES